MRQQEYVWTPLDIRELASLNLTKGGYRAYGVVLECADRRTGRFTLSKARAAAKMGCSKRTADRAFAELVRHGILVRDDMFRNGRQRANWWTLKPRAMWNVCRVFARAKLLAIRAKIEERRVAARERLERLQLLYGVRLTGPVPQQINSDGFLPAEMERMVAVAGREALPAADRSGLLNTGWMKRRI